ncbi:MAG: hypothetical protein ACI3YE_08350, partial [Candidatus Avispirillum sp.]
LTVLLLLALTGCGAKQKDGIAVDTGHESSGIADVNGEQINPEKALETVRDLLSDKSYFEDIEYELYEGRLVEGNEYIVVHPYTQQPIFNNSGEVEYNQQYTVGWFYVDKNTGEVFVENYVNKDGSELIPYENTDEGDEMQNKE